jgi:hypothetical protein
VERTKGVHVSGVLARLVSNTLNVELALALPHSARGVRIAFSYTMANPLGFLITVWVFLCHIPLILKSAWFPTRTSQERLDEDVSLLQLAEAFARRIERERAKMDDPETIRDVRSSSICFQALIPDPFRSSCSQSSVSFHPPTTPFWRCSILFGPHIVCRARY